MSNPFLAEIKIMGFNFAPRGWAQCNGQILPINQNQSLYSLLGTTYGGDGRTSFALPDLRGRTPMHFGDGPDGGEVRLGSKGGAETVTLVDAQIPAHTHNVSVNKAAGTSDEPTTSSYLAADNANAYGADAAPAVALNARTTTATGGSQPHSNMQPYQVVNFCIALQGTFPSRN